MERDHIEVPDELEIYISYELLNARDLGQYLINLSFMAEKIAEDYLMRFNDPNYEGKQPPILEVNSVHTGNSITIKLREGWKPSTKIEDGEIIIYVPKMLGIPLMVAASLATVAVTYQELRKNYLEIEIAKIELLLKQRELNKALDEDKSKHENFSQVINTYIDTKVPEIKPVLLDTIKAVIANPNINQFKVNNVEIKGNTKR
ncbi:hypothetical protein [Sphingobacterium sp.]|uniref:hypothetical protein n=1 Tax=Sphingobacterium sp. TaxID=341027 RepID=UPI0028AF100D|nr:hypothetical protein [Sphingobacterium sp.]